MVDADSKHLCLIDHSNAATAEHYRRIVACTNLTERIVVLGSFDHQSKDDKYHHEQEDMLVTSGENNLVQDGHDILQTLDLGVPTVRIGRVGQRVIASMSLMARTFALPWYLCEVSLVVVVGSEMIFDLAKTTASGNRNPRSVDPQDGTGHNDLGMDYGYYSVLVSMYQTCKCSGDHHYDS